ncbi:hypothetical protein ACIBCS_41920 [Streptomyces phaeochromogenes]|uniref:hypothetical protein n=1 Tax=Streptomyces phaeochromogenes TaxID=1923 RepID=UPI0037A29A98
MAVAARQGLAGAAGGLGRATRATTAGQHCVRSVDGDRHPFRGSDRRRACRTVRHCRRRSEPERALRLGERSLALASARRSGYTAPLIEVGRLTGQCLVELGLRDDALPLLEQALGRTRRFVLV